MCERRTNQSAADNNNIYDRESNKKDSKAPA
jgi:hypothetical protein